MAKIQIGSILKEVMDRYEVKNTDLARIAGTNPRHVSDIKAGRKSLSTELLTSMLEAFDELAPGARMLFCKMMAGTGEELKQSMTIGDKIAELVAIASDDDIAKTLHAVSERWKQGYRVDTSNSTNILENKELEKIPDKVGV